MQLKTIVKIHEAESERTEEKRDKSTIIVAYFNIPLPVTESRHK